MPVRLLLGTLCAGLLVQLLVPAVTPPVVLAVGLLSALVWTALGLSRDRLGALMAQGTLTALSLFALAAFAIVLAERTLLGEILSVLAPIIHVKTCFAMCAALRLARVVFQWGLKLSRCP